MFSKLIKFIMATSAIAPVGICYAIVGYIQGENTTYVFCLASIMMMIIIIAIVCLIITKGNMFLSTYDFKINSLEVADNESLSIIILYFLPLFENNINSLNWLATVPFTIIVAIIIWSSSGHHFNPIFRILGWHYFKVGTEEGITYVMISKRRFSSVRQNSKGMKEKYVELQIKHLSEYLVLDLGESK